MSFQLTADHTFPSVQKYTPILPCVKSSVNNAASPLWYHEQKSSLVYNRGGQGLTIPTVISSLPYLLTSTAVHMPGPCGSSAIYIITVFEIWVPLGLSIKLNWLVHESKSSHLAGECCAFMGRSEEGWQGSCITKCGYTRDIKAVLWMGCWEWLFVCRFICLGGVSNSD